MRTYNFVTDCGAAIDGRSDSSRAVGTWRRLAAANPGSTLYVPNASNGGANHYEIGNVLLRTGDTALTQGMIDPTIQADLGVSVSDMYIGSQNQYPNDAAHAAFIQTALPSRAGQVTLINRSDASKFRIGDWIMVSGLQTQGGGDGGYPPNWQYNEYRQIASISGATVTLDAPLVNAYLSTWPMAAERAFPKKASWGRAMISKFLSRWNSNIVIRNIEVTRVHPHSEALFIQGSKSLVVENCTFHGAGPSPSLSKSIVFRNCQMSDNGESAELDKNIEYLEFDNCTGSIYCQSSSIRNVIVKGGSHFSNFSLTPWNLIVENSTIGTLQIGGGYGVTDCLTVTNSAISTAKEHVDGIDPNQVEWIGDGIFRAPIATNNGNVYKKAVPGHCYVLAFTFGPVVINPDQNGGAPVNFCIQEMWDDSTYTYIRTDLTSLPRLTFLGNASNTTNLYYAYPASTLTYSNNTGADLSSSTFVAPRACSPLVPSSRGSTPSIRMHGQASHFRNV